MINTINLPSPTLSLKDSHTTAVQVAIRVRPLTESDQTQSRLSHSSDSNVIKTIGNTVTITPHQKSFHFDHVFDSESAQDQVYTGVVSNLVDRFLDGYNVTILAYGQTSSGKTHTIMGSAGLDQEGIIPRAMSAFFERLYSTASSPLSSTSQRSPSIFTSASIDSRLPPSPLSSSSSSPRSPASPTKLRPISTIITNSSYGNSNDSGPSRRDSAPVLLWKTLDKSPRNSVHVSFVEIYNEELVDLLNSSPLNERPHTAIREDTKGQIHWTGVKEVPVSKPEEALRCLQIGTDARATGSTDMNTKSSRSHAIFTVTLKQEKWIPAALSSSKSSDTSQNRETALSPVSSVSSTVGMNGRPTSLKIRTRIGQMDQQQQYGTSGKSDMDGDWMVVHSKLHFVDLAGSERLKRTSAEGDRRKEGININAGLLALGNVISALASDSSSSPTNNNNKKATHIPYRDSKLTRMLQDSLGGNAVTLMIACISPAERNLAETANTIKYAHRARHIKNRPGRNEAEDWVTSDNPELLRSLIYQLKSNIKVLKSEPHHHSTSLTDTDINAQLQQKISDCEQTAQLVSQRQSSELEKLKIDIGSLMQVGIKQDQIIHILEQKLVGMTQVATYLQRQVDLQDTYIMQLNNENQEKTQQVQSAQMGLQHMRREMTDLNMERSKLNRIVEWLDKLKMHHENGEIHSLVSYDELQRLYTDWDTDDLTKLPTAEVLGDIKKTGMSNKVVEENLDRHIDAQKSVALEKRLKELDEILERTTKDRDDLNHTLEYKQNELQVAQLFIEKQTTELAQVQRQVRDTMVLLEQERKLSEANDTSYLVADLEDKIQVLQRARELDQQEHDSQLDSVMEDLEKSQEAYEQQSHMVVSLKQTIQNMQQRLDTMPTTATSNQHKGADDSLRTHNQQINSNNNNSSKWIEEKAPMKPLKLRSSSSPPYPISSVSQTWSSSRNISTTAESQSDLATLTSKQNHNDINQTTVTAEMKEQLQQFNDKKIQLMMKILDMETQLRTQRSQFSSDIDILESDALAFGGGNYRMEKERKKHVSHHPPRKLRSATSQPLISNSQTHRLSTTSPPLISRQASPSPPALTQDYIGRHEIASTDDHMTKVQQTRSKRTSSSSTTTFLSTSTQTSTSSSSSTPQRTSSTHTAISTVSSSDIIVNSNTQTTAEQYNKMLHALQCQAQVSESNIHAHQDVIHKLERQLSKSETSVRDTKKQLEVLHKEKQAYALEIKNLRSQVTQMMTQQKTCLDESGERRKHLEIALEQERRLKEMAEKARLILENRMEVLMAKRNKFMCF